MLLRKITKDLVPFGRDQESRNHVLKGGGYSEKTRGESSQEVWTVCKDESVVQSRLHSESRRFRKVNPKRIQTYSLRATHTFRETEGTVP